MRDHTQVGTRPRLTSAINPFAGSGSRNCGSSGNAVRVRWPCLIIPQLIRLIGYYPSGIHGRKVQSSSSEYNVFAS